MNKAVLISIRPEWCNKIISGEKSVEVRKSKPEMKTPFKCYIYCTKGTDITTSINGQNGNQKVIGEFVCRYISSTLDPACGLVDVVDCERSCLTPREIIQYADGGILHFWYISELKIYENPREISEFRRSCENDMWCESCAMYSTNHEKCGNAALQIIRPPQSWCYVEEVEK